MPSSTIGESLPATLQIGLVKLFAKPMHMGLEEILVSGTGSSFLTLNRKERCSFSKKKPSAPDFKTLCFFNHNNIVEISPSAFFRLFFLTIGHSFGARGAVADYAGSCGYAHTYAHIPHMHIHFSI